MNTFKVRITGAAKGVYWYSDKVGKVFQVKASINKGFFTTVGVQNGFAYYGIRLRNRGGRKERNYDRIL